MVDQQPQEPQQFDLSQYLRQIGDDEWVCILWSFNNTTEQLVASCLATLWARRQENVRVEMDAFLSLVYTHPYAAGVDWTTISTLITNWGLLRTLLQVTQIDGVSYVEMLGGLADIVRYVEVKFIASTDV